MLLKNKMLRKWPAPHNTESYKYRMSNEEMISSIQRNLFLRYTSEWALNTAALNLWVSTYGADRPWSMIREDLWIWSHKQPILAPRREITHWHNLLPYLWLLDHPIPLKNAISTWLGARTQSRIGWGNWIVTLTLMGNWIVTLTLMGNWIVN